MPGGAEMRGGPRALALGAALCLGIAGCAGHGAKGTPPPVGPSAAPSAPRVTPQDLSNRSAPLVEFYASVEGNLTASGRMRRDTAPADAPYTVEDLVRNFERIALYDEYIDMGGRFVRSETPSYLRRWNRPVRVGVMTGPSTAPEDAARDRANVAAFSSRLARLTGLDMTMSKGSEVNFLVLFMNDTERTAFAEQVSRRYADFAPAVMGAFRDTALDTFCTAYAFGDPGDPAVYSAVMILIRAEHPPLTRLSCVQEEMAQAMGLPNDSAAARPSLFNDSLEFALLTEHDEVLLRMLYDPRLRPGMTADEARPLLPDVARSALAAQNGASRVAAVATN